MTSFTPSRLLLSSRNLHPHGVLMAGGLAFTCLLGTPAQAVDQYCIRNNPGACAVNAGAGFAANTDTYFWSPSTPPALAINLNSLPFTNKVKKLTLRGSSNVTINAIGNKSQAEVLIGSLGSNRFDAGNSANVGADTFVVGNPPALVSCQGSGVGCTVSGIQGAENDNVVLSSINGEIIYIDRCLQMTAPNAANQPGRGGAKIATATKAIAADPAYAAITDVAGTCPIASLGIQDLQTTAQRGRDALLSPWERWWSATAPWSRGLHWLQQAMIALIQGPHAQAGEASATPKQQPTLRVARYEGVTRVIQNDPQGNFLLSRKENGSTIVVDAGTYRFNGQILESKRSNSTVYPQRGDEQVPLKKGIVFVYHEPLGILAAYPNDLYPYGSERNRGSVIAQLVLGDGSALPASSINYVLPELLSQSQGNSPVPTRTKGGSTPSTY